MKISDKIKRSFGSLRSSKARSALTILGVAVASFVLASVLGLGEGARQQTIKFAASISNEREIYVTPKIDPGKEQINPQDTLGIQKYTDPTKQQTQTNKKEKYITTKDIENIRKVPQVEKVIPQYQFTILYLQPNTPKSDKYTAVFSQFNPVVHPEFVAGSINGELATDQIIIPEAFLSTLGFSSPNDAIGKPIYLSYNNASGDKTQVTVHKVGAVTKSSVSPTGSSNQIFISEQLAKSIYELQTKPADRKGFNQVTALTVSGLTTTQTNEVINQINQLGLNARSSSEDSKDALQIINGIQIFLLIFAGATLLTSLFGIINTEIISILERYKEIGLMKAIGMHNSTLFSIFLLEAFWIGLIGSTIGITLTVVASIFLNPVIAQFIGIFDAQNPALIFTIKDMLIIVGLICFVSVLGGILPSWKATRLDPINILRTE
jgi:putative ABC transport system permease protein